MWNKIYQVPGTFPIPLIPESMALAQYHMQCIKHEALAL